MKVTRDQMIKIHSIACGDWKAKIERKMLELGLVIGTEAEIDTDFVKAMFGAANASQMEVLNKIFPGGLSRNVLENVDTSEAERKANALSKVLFGNGHSIQMARTWASDVKRPDLVGKAIGFYAGEHDIQVHRTSDGSVVLEFVRK